MKQKLIIMTTAIVRPVLHINSIGHFYKKYYEPYMNEINEYYEIYHVINIDYPEKLKKHFTVVETIDNFNQIIPENVFKIYITPENPSFLQAFKNIMHKIEEVNLLSEDNFYWWFEDDWVGKNGLNFFKIIMLLKNFRNSALTITRNCPIGSFRGGPVMSGYYFMNFFNIERLGYMNDTCDPERQVGRYLRADGNIIFPNSVLKKREIIKDSDKNINILLVYFDTRINKINADFSINYYKDKFNKEIIFNYHLCMINNYNLDEINYLNYENNININDTNSYKIINKNQLKELLDSESILYIIIKPFCFEDCGRDFASSYNLIKGWQKMGDPLTYS